MLLLMVERGMPIDIVLTADEPNRIKGECYPLVDWGITEREALQICYDRGYEWGGL